MADLRTQRLTSTVKSELPPNAFALVFLLKDSTGQCSTACVSRGSAAVSRWIDRVSRETRTPKNQQTYVPVSLPDD